MSEMRIMSWFRQNLSQREQVQPLPPSPIVPLVAVLRKIFRNVALRKMKKTSLLFRGDGLMSESKLSFTQQYRTEGWFQKGQLCFSLHCFITSRLMFLHSLGLKCCDHSFTKSLIAAVINFKFSQPNADYQQSLLQTTAFIAFYIILLVSSILAFLWLALRRL